GKSLQIVLDGTQVLGQFVEQWFVDGRIGRAHVVERLDQTAAKVVRPQPIGDGAGEEGIVGCRQPAGQHRPPIRGIGEISRRCAQRLDRHRRLRPWMTQLTPLLREDDLASSYGLAADPREEAGQGEVILLSPAVGWMMMTLSALDADAEEQLAERSA